MWKLIKNNKNTIKAQTLLLLTIFGSFTFIIFIVAIFMNSPINFYYMILFILTLTGFGIFVSVTIEYLILLREKRFFKKSPFSELEKRTIDLQYVQKNKYSFPKTQRIVEIANQKIAVEYYDDIFKVPFSDILIAYNLTNPLNEPVVLNYKKTNFNSSELLEIICGKLKNVPQNLQNNSNILI